ncbi:MAG: type II toxin-antitoxin system PrlF family antitoxin [Shewanella sp.]|nr:type II toxin-antitoxin system PrlF family antitoxin [Shewanella sp.]
MAHTALETESTLTDRFQTTIPSTVRQALHLEKKDKIRYVVQSDGSVLIMRAEVQESDPVLDEFLVFLADDMQQHPKHLQPLTANMDSDVEALVSGINFDLDAQLSDEDE